MPKRKTLNGMAHNITKSFFGTERYYGRGYMGDWLLKAARRIDLKTASLDVIKAKFDPEELNLYPLVFNAKQLKEIINKELIANGFDTDFIVEAKIDFKFLDPSIYRSTIYCYPYLIDKSGRRYEHDRIIAEGLEQDFDPFDELNLYPTIPKPSLFLMTKKFFGIK